MKRLIIASQYSSIEPLGIMCLATVAKVAGWEVKIYLAKERKFEPVVEEAIKFGASMVAFSVWTGYHLQIFSVSSKLKSLGIKVAMGGPHVTYFASECQRYSNWAVRGEGFRMFRRILEGLEPEGICFDPKHLAEGFPMPDRESVYERYPEFAGSPIKSVICSLGCPFSCSYCYNSLYKKIYNGFSLNVRPVDDIVEEVLRLQKRWPLQLVYFQDDIFGFNLSWLSEFAKKWKEKVGIPWHCQIRLELAKDERRLDLFKEAGCTGITTAVESGVPFLRELVLSRHMSDETILGGTRRIADRGLALRTEQILAVPFSDIDADLETLKLNVRINPTLAWSSILVPYIGTQMGNIVSQLGFYGGHNDDISDTFFEKSVLTHVKDGYRSIEEAVLRNRNSSRNNPLMKMTAVKDGRAGKADIYFSEGKERKLVCQIEYLREKQNTRYCHQAILLQRLFSWLAKVPEGGKLGRNILSLPLREATWKKIGELAGNHSRSLGYGERLSQWENTLALEMGFKLPTDLPSEVRDNFHYFCFFPGSGRLAKKFVSDCIPLFFDRKKFFDSLATLSRRWLYTYSLYKLEPATDPISCK